MKPTSITSPCPECGAPLQLVLDGRVGVPYFNPAIGGIEWRAERRPFVACTGCEFCLDLTEANPQLLGKRLSA